MAYYRCQNCDVLLDPDTWSVSEELCRRCYAKLVFEYEKEERNSK